MQVSENNMTSDPLPTDIEELRARLEEAEETLRAIRSGAVDALVVQSPEGQQVFTLKGAEHTYRMLVETMSEGALTMDQNGMILYSNARFATLLRQPLEKVIGANFQAYVQPSQLAAFNELLHRSNHSRRGEFYLLTTGQALVPVYVAMSALTIDDGSEAIGTVVTDLTDQKHAEELARNKDELEKLVTKRTASLQATTDQLNSFCYSMAHDLRAPLRQQRGFGNVLLEDFSAELGELGQSYVKKIVAGADRLERLVDDLLTHASLRQQNLPMERTDLVRVVQQARLDLTEQITKQKAVVNTDLPPTFVKAHEATLNLVVSNLISNSIKYVAEGVVPKIRIRSEDRGNTTRLWVEDNGIGIPREFHDQIFGVFQRLHTKESYPGTGMGLAIVQKGMESMGGRSGVESKPGEGSRFWIELATA
jgi:PAS domain S-box-containing protein